MKANAKVRRAAACAVAAALLLAGCGGGIYIGYSDDDDDDDPPRVTLSVSSAGATPGTSLRLTADARDDRGVYDVDFYRIDPDGRSVLLGTDSGSPFDWNTTLPSSAVRGSTVYYYARAFDGRGQSANSDNVGVVVQ